MKHKKQLEERTEDIKEENENIKNPFWDHGRKPTLYVCKMFYGKKKMLQSDNSTDESVLWS